MKTKILSLMLAMLMLASVFTSCSPDVADSGVASVVIETDGAGDQKYEVYEIKLERLADTSNGALSLLEYLAKEENGSLDYTNSNGMITEISSLKNDYSASKYIMIYTSVEADFAVPNADFPTVASTKYGDVELKLSGVGLSSMAVTDGTVILFRLEEYK